MSSQRDDPILEAYITETSQLVEQLEEIILACEETNRFDSDAINEIFRIMHTIKGSSAMMNYTSIAALAHALEDLFSLLRSKQVKTDWSAISDLILQGVDFTKLELYKIENGDPVDGDAEEIIKAVKYTLQLLEQQQETGQSQGTTVETVSNRFKALVWFAEDCGMENVRAYQIVHRLEELVDHYEHIPEDLMEDVAADAIRHDGFQLFLTTRLSQEEIHRLISESSYLGRVELEKIEEEAQDEDVHFKKEHGEEMTVDDHPLQTTGDIYSEHKTEVGTRMAAKQANRLLGQTITVNVDKLDELMDLVGELVLAEAMVTQNPDLVGLELEQFQKASRHLQKIIKEVQDKVMDIRMVPLAMTFQRMNRVVRDMSKSLGKNVQLELVGEQTEVDKNIIEHITDPIMHLVRNAIDHGIETAQERQEAGKPETATLTLAAQNVGGDVLIFVRDDGRGLNKESILQKARQNQLVHKPEEEMTDREIYNLIFLPGFSTKEAITEFSGRGVGMDVVVQNIAAVGGTVSVDSMPGEGTTFTLKIPLTLAIIDGMNVRVGASKYTIPTTSIIESFKPQGKDIITDPSGQEMIMVRGNCYPIIRLHEKYRVQTEIVHITEGVLIMVEQDGQRTCIFVDELLGQQQVVVKALPTFIKGFHSIEGISGCTILGDGDISLILDIQGLLRT